MTAQEQADLAYYEAKQLEYKLRVVAAEFSAEGNYEKSTKIWAIANSLGTQSYQLLKYDVTSGPADVMHHPV